jgi:ABC-type polysaccharide/polyol phosphate transport system ATPase subunit
VSTDTTPIQIEAKRRHALFKKRPKTKLKAGVAIRVSKLSKLYKVYPKASSILKEQIFRRSAHTAVSALSDVSFEVRRGEIVGLVGANGAGKSTLLSILAGVLDPTSGSFQINGDLRAILQLGTGFQDEYTGRENVYMGGYCIGYSKAEIDRVLDWIIDFSGLRRVIDQPFRTYSSGMKARLTFSVTFCQKTDVLIVDEALSAGDLAFQQKCINRILELCSGGATALVVSHSMYFIEKLCSRALYLQDGELLEDGRCKRVTRLYERRLLEEFANENEGAIASSPTPTPDSEDLAEDLPDALPPVSDETQALLDDPEDLCPAILHLELVKLIEVRILDADRQPLELFHTGATMTIEITVDSMVAKDNIAIGIQIHHESNIHVATSTNLVHLDEEGDPQASPLSLRRGRQTFSVTFPQMFLADGRYYIDVGMNPKMKHFTEADQLLRERRVAVFGFYRSDTPWKVLYDPPSSWKSVRIK